MNFHIDTAEALTISDQEITELLSRVYVDGGFTTAEVAISLFEPAAVRSRGKIIAAREKQHLIFAGMVITVYPDSPARRLARDDETEMQLLGVKPEYRGNSLGKMLVEAAIDDAKQKGYSKMLLSTQLSMQAAHHLYELSGFIRAPDRNFSRGGRDFWAYEKQLSL